MVSRGPESAGFTTVALVPWFLDPFVPSCFLFLKLQKWEIGEGGGRF